MRSLQLVAATLLGASLFAAPAGADTTPSASITVSTSTPEDDAPVDVTGRVTTVPAGTTVELQRNIGSGWTPVSTFSVGEDGTFATTYRPVVGKNQLRVSVPSTNTTRTASSTSVSLSVVPAMSPDAPITTDTLTFSGHLPTPLARTVRLQIADAGAWKTVATGRSTSAGVFSLQAPLGRSAQVRVEAPKERVKSKSRARFDSPAREVTLLPAPFVSTPAPSISGTAQAGKELAAQVSGWDAGVSFTYQWLRDDLSIDKATAPTLTLDGDDVGHHVAVEVTGQKAGYVTEKRTSASTDEVQTGTLTAADPRVTGRLEIGATVKADTAGWGPGTVGFSYQWRRDGADIADATRATYLLADADKGAHLAVQVIGSRAGYTSETRSSSETDAITAPTCGKEDPVKHNGDPWTCTFSDEFDGASLDATKWMPQQTAVSGLKSGPGCIVGDPDNVSVGGGVLRLTARREDKPFTCRSPNGDSTTQYTNGSVTSNGRFSQAFGRYEFRAKFANVKVPGIHGAIWLYPIIERYGPWPQSGEIDVAEIYSRYPDRSIPYVHYKTADPNNPTVTNTGCKLDPSQFHTYLLEWTSTTITISYDGTVCIKHTIAPASPLPPPQPFGRPFAVILTQVQGRDNSSNQFDPATTPLPATMQVDYVHVWK